MIHLALSLVVAMADGDLAMSRGDHDAAAQSYRAEAEAHPELYEARIKLANALSLSKHHDAAIQIYTELLAARPDDPDLLLARGRVYTLESRWPEAEADLTAATAHSPDHGDAWSALGDLYLRSDRPRDAVNAYSKWIAADPKNPRAYLARTIAYRSAGEFAAARADFDIARAYGTPDPGIDLQRSSLQQSKPEQGSAVPEKFTWLASLSYDFSTFSTDRSNWHYYNAALRRYWERGSLGFEYLHSRRFDSNDYAFALDAYVDLWQRAYANVRYQYSPRAVLYPDDSYRVEIYQEIETGWELAGSYDHMDFTARNVDMYGVALGKYTGNWYLRWRTLFIPTPAKLGTAHRALARYYYAGNGDDYLEINGEFSRGAESLEGTTIVETTRGQSVGAAFQTYFNPRWGIRLSAGYDDGKTLFEQSIVEKLYSAKILTRW